MNNIDIALTFNDGYIKQATVVMYSVLKNSSREYKYHFWLVTYDLKSEREKEIRRALVEFEEMYSLDIVYIDKKYYDKIPMIGGFGKEANFRLFLPLLLPNVSKILYLDCDILCLGDISTLYNIDVSNSPYAAKSEKNFFTLATNPYSKNTFPTLEFFWTLGYDLFDIDYTNAGVMLVNNDYWRQHNYVQRSLEFFAKHKQNKNFRFPDQDILNYLAFQDGSDSRVLFDGKYNILVSIFPYVFGLNSGIDELSELDSTDFRCNFLMKLLSIDNFDKSFQPVIVHYAGPKPWNGQAAIYNKVYQEYSLKIGWDIRLCNAKKIAKYNITKSNIKKTIKYMLPYGVVRYLQKRK